MRLVIVLLLLTACWFAPGLAGADCAIAPSLDFIYVNANTGEAAGGHTAVRLGATVFHFQFFPQGRFLLVRDSWSHFRYVYNELRNRSIFLARLPLAQQGYNRLRNHFTDLLIAQQQDLEKLQGAEQQLRLIRQLAEDNSSVELTTIGLFDSNTAGNVDMLNLYRLLQRYFTGSTTLTAMEEQVNKRLVQWAIVPKQTDESLMASRLQELLLEREFFRILGQGFSLARHAVVSTSSALKLTPEEQKFLQTYRQKLAASVVNLLQSGRPDRAEDLLLQTARYLVVSRSLATGRLLTLDPFSSDAVSVSINPDENLQGLYRQLEQDAIRARHEFFQESTHPDIAYAILETARGRWHEVEGALLKGRPVRVEQGILLPVRSGRITVDGLPADRPVLQALVVEKKADVTRLRQQLADRYTYDLIRRNCATALVHAVNSAFPDRETGRRELGGWLESNNDLVFIPNRFYALVAKRFPVSATERIPSRRLRKLEALYEREPDLPVWLQESNTLSSSLYTPRIDDTPFLFFTDDLLLLRPILGITNLCWAAVHSAVGLFTLPMDGGVRIQQGMRGMFYSLPELIFSNIRKGTYGFAAMVPPGP
jgi:hypothetical protein